MKPEQEFSQLGLSRPLLSLSTYYTLFPPSPNPTYFDSTPNCVCYTIGNRNIKGTSHSSVHTYSINRSRFLPQCTRGGGVHFFPRPGDLLFPHGHSRSVHEVVRPQPRGRMIGSADEGDWDGFPDINGC
ncbi:hypothetical protein CDAR_234891 [Caerostris darwini]|uniref:Uncharacterized protein n=1 Tax=Caerostris darwini TaxID=1538125 RepID=A0AAV4SX64_9ARAC|nr:hypothetical protein CDAR_234891 [Caerostris darwini]